MTAQEIVHEKLFNLGERHLYFVTEQEFIVLLSSGGYRIEPNEAEVSDIPLRYVFYDGLVFCAPIKEDDSGGVD